MYDISGREISTLLERKIDAGSHDITWNAATQPAGVYFCRLEADGFVQTIKLALVK